MTRIALADLQGGKGDRGEVGAQGLPGVNAVANDNATAGYVATTGTSATKSALDARYSRIGQQVLNARDPQWAIVADGSDETAKIQTFLDAAAGQVAYFPPGTYTLTMVNGRTGTTIMGAGRGATTFVILGNDSSTNNRIKLYDISDVTLRDFTITETNVLRRVGSFGPISGSNVVRLKVENVEVDGSSGTGMHFMLMKELIVTGCYIHNTMADGLHIQRGSQNVIVSNNIINDNGDDAIGFVSHAEATAGYCMDIVITGNILGPTKTDYIGAGIALIGIIGANVTGNQITGTASGGIRITSIGEDSEGFAVVGNIVVTGNRISTVGFYAGLVAGQLTSGIDIFNARNVLVANNLINAAYRNGVTVSQCSIDVSIKNNVINKPGSRGVFVATLRQVGLYLEMWTHPRLSDGRAKSYVSHHNLTISGNEINSPANGGITAQGADVTSVIEGLTLFHNRIRSPNVSNATGVVGILTTNTSGLFSTLNDVGASSGTNAITAYQASALTAVTLNASNYSTPAF